MSSWLPANRSSRRECNSTTCLLVRLRRMLTAITQTAQPKTLAQVERTIAMVRFSDILMNSCGLVIFTLVFRRLLNTVDHYDLNRPFLCFQPESELLLQGGEN